MVVAAVSIVCHCSSSSSSCGIRLETPTTSCERLSEQVMVNGTSVFEKEVLK